MRPRKTLISTFLESAPFRTLLSELRSGRTALCASGLTLSARALFLTALNQELQRPVAIICRSNSELEQLENDINFFLTASGRQRAGRVLTIPASEVDPYGELSPHPEIEQRRAITLDALARGDGEILIIPVKALIERIPSPREILNLSLKLKVGEDSLLEEIVEMLEAIGYLREEPVTEVGTYSMRGGILDVFSPGSEQPFRIEFFGDTIESLRSFDPETQRSTARLDTVRIHPMRTQAIRSEDLKRLCVRLQKQFAQEQHKDDLRRITDRASAGEFFDGWEYLIPLVTEPSSSIFDYLKNPLIVVDEPSEIEEILQQFYKKMDERYQTCQESGILALEPSRFFMNAESLKMRLGHRQRVELRSLGIDFLQTDEEFAGLERLYLFPVDHSQYEHRMRTQLTRKFHSNIPELAEELKLKSQRGTHNIIVAHSLGVAERIVELLRDYEVRAELRPDLHMATEADRNIVTVGRLTSGIEAPEAGLHILVESDIYDEANAAVAIRQAKKRSRQSLKSFLSDFRDLKIGDYVVHVDHGIGQFQGLQQIAVNAETKREFMLLTYADGAKLFVPVERLDLVQKYSSSEGLAQPSLDKLGGVSWQKTKTRVKAALRDMAEELLKLYAERKLVKRKPFTEDTAWQHEFEDAFEFQLTPDQEAAIGDIKADLHSETPMDRLLCGDVGFGKTEVAMRAAFKAIVDSKQVAVLAPTTVLAYQHYKTFQKRFASFPVNIELLSRFRSPKEQKETLKKLDEGRVDILVGTHRILSKDVKFKDLGLLIIDEEQRFGVAHKERLKQMRRRVDVLTMSATPIPRTLNMSLVGLRDMSIIETPPSDRLSVQTHVVQFSEAVIKTAVELELQRGGQVFFVHNRVETIYTMAELIRRLVPGLRIGVAHGQMGEDQLEDIMLKFIEHELDILVTTTIIENGIDIPLANTIIIDRADNYGLSQLYQLRGRVGRSNRRAYAYLLIPSEKTLTPIARKRLSAIREFSDLGSGFRIAALDLELRGAGNLLGAEQSGQIEAVGFDLYCQMLERTVQELRGEEIEEEITSNINLGVDVRIPDDYISDIGQRLRTYKRISAATTESEIAAIREELEDRYGPKPESLENLFRFARLRSIAQAIGILSIDFEGGQLVVKVTEKSKIDPDVFIEMVSTENASFSPSGILKVKLGSNLDSEKLFTAIQNLLLKLARRE